MARITKSLSFAVTREDEARIQDLSERYAEGERSRLLRLMLDRMEAQELAEELQEIQAYGVAQAVDAGMGKVDVHDVVQQRTRKGTPSDSTVKLVEDVLASFESASTPSPPQRPARKGKVIRRRKSEVATV
jgi:Asp-tRNA(Asn)/Glu-tRNA(Gln) amidotransferase C subunit